MPDERPKSRPIHGFFLQEGRTDLSPYKEQAEKDFSRTGVRKVIHAHSQFDREALSPNSSFRTRTIGELAGLMIVPCNDRCILWPEPEVPSEE